jgi:hypothetical protein
MSPFELMAEDRRNLANARLRGAVRCEECNCVRRSLSLHVRRAHGLTVAEYIERHPGANLGTTRTDKRR